MTALTQSTATTLSKALERLAAFGVNVDAFCAVYGIAPHTLLAAVHDEEPRLAPRLLVIALRLLAELVEADNEGV